MTQVWKPIPSTGGVYEASDRGEIRSVRGVLKPWRDSNGYEVLRVCHDGKQRAVLVHRLVAEAFHGPAAKMDVNHIDGNKTNNRPDNLEWCSRKQNMRHAMATGLVAAVRAVIAMPKAGGDALKFASSKDAALALGGLGKWGNIKSALCGRVPSAYGYQWQYDSQA